MSHHDSFNLMPHPDLMHSDEPRPGGFDVIGAHLSVREGQTAILPCVCAVCGSSERGGEYVDKSLTWSPRWVLLTALISPLLWVITYMATRKTVQTQYYLCPACSAKYSAGRKFTAMGWGSLIGIVGLGIFASSAEIVLLGSMAVLVAMIVTLLVMRPAIKVCSYDRGTFLLRAQDLDFSYHIRSKSLPSTDHEPLLLADEFNAYNTPSSRPKQAAAPSPMPGPLGTDGSI